MTCPKCDERRMLQADTRHQVSKPCDICNDTGTDYLGRSCRHECSPPRLMVGFLGEDHPLPVVHDGELWPDAEEATFDEPGEVT